jgi:hypothetical protein
MPDGTICAGISPDTGKPMYTTDADASATMTFNEAKEYAAKLNLQDLDDTGQRKGWHLPTRDELKVLFNNRAAIGGFNVTGSSTTPASVVDPAGWYWSASENYVWDAWGQRFSDGYQFNYGKGTRSSVRCVR